MNMMQCAIHSEAVNGGPLFGSHSNLSFWKHFASDARYAETVDEFEVPQGRTELEETSHKCWGGHAGQRICKFYNLLLWNDTFYYVTTEESVLEAGIPEIALSWVHIEFAENMRFAEGGIARMVRPEQLPFSFTKIPKLHIEDAVLWHLTYHDNFGHLLGEHGPTLHNVLCSYMGRCGFNSRDRDVHLLLPHNEDDMLAVVPAAAREMFQCFTKHPLRQTDELIFRGKVLVIKTALVGVGPSCRGFPWCRPNYGRSPLSSAQILQWRKRIMKCLDLPTQAAVYPEKPYLVIVNRPPSVGRSFLNINEVVATLQVQFPELLVSVQQMDGRSLAQQAAVYANASIVVQAHGAALGNVIFLPRGASVIDISPTGHEDKPAWIFFMAADYRPLHFNPIRVPVQRAVPMLHQLKTYKQWHLLSPAWRRRIISEGVCPSDEDVDEQFSINIWCKFYWILKHSNMVLDPQQISAAVNSALLSLKQIAQTPLPPLSLSHRYAIG